MNQENGKKEKFLINILIGLILQYQKCVYFVIFKANSSTRFLIFLGSGSTGPIFIRLLYEYKFWINNITYLAGETYSYQWFIQIYMHVILYSGKNKYSLSELSSMVCNLVRSLQTNFPIKYNVAKDQKIVISWQNESDREVWQSLYITISFSYLMKHIQLKQDLKILSIKLLTSLSLSLSLSLI